MGITPKSNEVQGADEAATKGGNMLGYGLLGTIVVVALVVWLVRAL